MLSCSLCSERKRSQSVRVLVSHHTNLSRVNTIHSPMSTSSLFTRTGTDQSVIGLAEFAAESDKLQEFVAKNTIRIGQKIVIDSENLEVTLHPDEQIFNANEAKHEEVREQKATTQQELEQRRVTKSNV